MNTRIFCCILILFLLSGCVANQTPPPVYYLPSLLPLPTHSPSPITETSTVAPILTPPTENAALSPTNTQPNISTETATLTQQGSTSSPQTITCQVPPGWVMYTVQRNDTLSALSQRTGTSVTQIQAANCLADTLIFAGQSLYLPFIPLLPTIGITGTLFSTVPSPTNTKFPTPPPPGPGDETLTVTPGFGPPGTTFIFTLEKFVPIKEIKVVVTFADSGAIVFEQVIIADGSGNATLPYVSPQNAMAGSYNVYAIANDPPLTKFKEFMITSSP